MVKRFFILIILTCSVLYVKAQVSCIAQTQIDRRSVYAQQPFKVTITVITATWYTAPLDFDNIQIPNAFIMPFYKTTPGMFPYNGKQYAGLQFYYIVFPYKEGHYTLPAINIVAETPPIGDSKAQKVTVKTQPISYIVKPVPKNFSSDSWFVAKDVVINESWDKPLKGLKVGDVINRTIVVDAKGTLPQFIPDLKTDSLPWCGVYPKQASLADTRDDYDANGERTQTITYLLEKEGDFIIPQTTIQWFNPNSGHIYKRSTSLVKIHIAPNPNLGILKTLQDSLKAKAPFKATITVKKGPQLIYGIAWYYFVLYGLAALCILYFVIDVLVRIIKKIHARYKAYLLSEKYWFGKFSRSSLKYPELLNNLYAWWDHFPVLNKRSSIQLEARENQLDNIDQEMTTYYKHHYANGASEIDTSSDLKKDIKKYRDKILHSGKAVVNKQISISQTEWEK
jgi:hypothetical protein